MTDEISTCAEACAKADAANADNSSSAQQSVNDWIAGFAKKSQEERAKRAAEKQIAPPPDEKALIEVLARKDYAEYDRVRADLAETLGMRVGTLDAKVEALRKKMEAEDDKDDPPHWKVEPWPEPATGAELLDSIRRVFRRYIVLPKDADIALSLWVLHAWTMDARRYLAVHGAGVADEAVRQDQRSHPAVLPDAEVRAREQHHGGRAISLCRGHPADAPHRRSRYVREEQRGASGHPGFWPYEGSRPR